ncbi:hypothetical protein Cme02nite_69290 [Catellatospora methionotrophica]|uniref:Uncharacterized protein n=1 Tax=Catellatospora methionotrophica TaxID=121620 RepID=A0A8J3LCZ8_9ACTN|nr:hypothetical protein Cme02nite_69290 [Catellatospora methionotrophica]
MTSPDPGLEDVIADKARERAEAYAARKATSAAVRKQLHEARQHGLRARHAAKLRGAQ